MDAQGFGAGARVETDRNGEWGRFSDGTRERAVLLALGGVVGTPLRPVRLRLADGSRVEFDGAASDASALVQLPLRGGEFTSAHRNKLMADMFKLSWARTTVAPHARGILCTGVNATAAFRGGAWLARAAEDMGVDVYLWDDGALVPAISPAPR